MSDYQPACIAGVILAGGRAERMGGRDKGLLPLAGQPMIAHAIHTLRPQVGRLIINANRHLDAYRALGYQVVSDDIEGFCGPLAGMLAALNATDAAYILTIPCDCPLLPDNYARRMGEALVRDKVQLSVAYDGQRLQPVFALLNRGLCGSLQQYLASGEREVKRWFARHKLARADFSDYLALFRNINTPQDLAALEQEMQRGSVY